MAYKEYILPVLLMAVLCSCGPRRQAAPSYPCEFPTVQIPSVYNSVEERIQYSAAHWWDGFFALDGPVDSALVLGVRKGEVEQALANYLAALDRIPFGDARGCMAKLFKDLSAKQRADTTKRLYTVMTEMVGKYLYDPNSPLRDEDYYQPFVQGMAESDLTSDAMRTACRYEAKVCAMNPRGSVAPDFRITRRNGSSFRLHQVKAGKTVLFFSNPGCHACQEIIDALTGDERLVEMVRDGRLAVVNVYIDEDIDAWRKYEPAYPREWHCGYDATHTIREDVLYSVRAIPSLYLLDSDKRVILKDAPTEKVLAALLGQ